MLRFLNTSKAEIAVLVLGYILILSPSQAEAQGIAINPTSWDFGDVLLGNSDSVIFDVECVAGNEVYVETIELSEFLSDSWGIQETSFFSITSAPATPLFIPEGDMINIHISFAPTTVGFYDAFLHIRSDVSQEHHYIPLQGNCVIPEPSSMLLACLGLAGLAGLKRKLGLERNR